MRLIIKNREPEAWTKYRQTPGAHYQPIPELVESLLEEQGYICAYCNRRVPCRDDKFAGAEDHRIDHLRTQQSARESGDDSDLDYSNMVICCPGNVARDGEDNYHCDKKKHNSDLRISPLDPYMMSTIRFTPSGIIKSTDNGLDKEINDNLNLNQDLLKRNRKEVWSGIVTILKAKGWSIGNVRHLISVWGSKHKITIGEKEVLAYKPYCSMVLFMLNKKLNMLESK